MFAHRRKWFRLSLRTAMLVITFTCIWLTWLSHSWKQQEHALAQIRALGGNLVTEPSPISWLVDLLPSNNSVQSQRVLAVTFLGPKVGDAEVEAVVDHISILPDLDSVKFVDTAITSVGEEHLRNNLPALEIQVISTAWRDASTSSR